MTTETDQINRAEIVRVVGQPPEPLALLQQAIAGGVPVETLEKLTDLAERHTAMRAKQAFTRALNAAQTEMPPVYKDSQNAFNKTRYASLEQVQNTVRPVYLRHGFSITFGQDPAATTPGMIRLFVDLSHVEGHTERYYGEFPMDEAGSQGKSNKSAIQAVGSAFSYGRRYLLGLVFNLVFTNEDNDGQPVARSAPSREVIRRKVNTDEIAAVKDKLHRNGKSVGAFLSWAGSVQNPDKKPLDYLPEVWLSTYCEFMDMQG